MTKLDADKITYQEALNIIKKLPLTKYLLPVGSVASKQPNPRDLDFLTSENLQRLYYIYIEVYPEIWHQTSLGTKRFDYYPIIDGKKVAMNFWKITKENLPFFYFTYAYPRQFVIAIRKKAKNLGYKLNQEGIYKDDQKLNINNLSDIFKFFNLPYRTPEQEYQKHHKSILKSKGGQKITFDELTKRIPSVKETYKYDMAEYPTTFERDFDRPPTQQEINEANEQYKKDIISEYEKYGEKAF